jgi:hypothetical protein
MVSKLLSSVRRSRPLPYLRFDIPEILDRIFGQVSEVVFNLGFFVALVFDVLIGFETS